MGFYDTRTWKIFGEGPAIENAAPLSAQGFNEGKGKPFTAEDVRFTKKDNQLYATFFGWPESKRLTIKNLTTANYRQIQKASLLGSSLDLKFSQNSNGLTIELPENKPALNYANVVKLV